jgi:hypothetical protein
LVTVLLARASDTELTIEAVNGRAGWHSPQSCERDVSGRPYSQPGVSSPPTVLSYRPSVRLQGWIDNILWIGEPQASSEP